MNAFWKVLGAAALVAGFTPYKIENNEETGEKTVQALLWKVSSTPKADGDSELSVGFGLYLPGKAKTAEEEMFADDVMEPVAPMAEPMVMSSEDEAAPACQCPCCEEAPAEEPAPVEEPVTETAENVPEEA